MDKVKVDNPPEALYKLGDVVDIAYRTKRNMRDKPEDFRHTFDQSARPVLAATHDGKSLYILGGGYKVTAKGIVG